MQSVKTIKLSGSLGRRFGVFHHMAVDSFPECIRALSYQVKGFKAYMSSQVGARMRYALFVDGKNIGESDFQRFACAKEIRIIPIPSASKNGGLMQIVMGAIIMVAAFYTGGASLAAMGALSSSAFMMGGSMVLGGITQILSPQSGGISRASESVENKPSYAFGGAINTTAAGYPIQLPYGERDAGGALFASGSYAEDIS
ncbi:tail assembly protein [Gibbsiella quercinecans]|uniref:tail assembly protein n=1 Tax=Gibbsiella quercinecans TaxID=929813 RepID=UPI00242E8FEE|nr:tail assembly protein [Gibbsiella quercinecans]